MIKYSLRCAEGHSFESWFASADAYESLAGAGRLACAVCGGTNVSKAMMAPRVSTGDVLPPIPAGKPHSTPARPLAEPASAAEEALTAFREKVEANTEDVGRAFAKEARAIHDGEAPERAIRGQARPAEARALLEDGVPVLPLPFAPTRQVN